MITIDSGRWLNLTDDEREEVIFHELGHCVYLRDHTQKRLPNGEANSLMFQIWNYDKNVFYPTTAVLYKGLRKKHYIDEMFNENTAPPTWAANTPTDALGLSISKKLLVEDNLQSTNEQNLVFLKRPSSVEISPKGVKMSNNATEYSIVSTKKLNDVYTKNPDLENYEIEITVTITKGVFQFILYADENKNTKNRFAGTLMDGLLFFAPNGFGYASKIVLNNPEQILRIRRWKNIVYLIIDNKIINSYDITSNDIPIENIMDQSLKWHFVFGGDSSSDITVKNIKISALN
jgi:hypothetical protein